MVVVVVTMREGSLGSGMRFDCENLSEPRFMMASSAVNVCSNLVNRTRWVSSFRLTINVEKRSLKSRVYGLSSAVMRRRREEVWCIFAVDMRAEAPWMVCLLLLDVDCRGWSSESVDRWCEGGGGGELASEVLGRAGLSRERRLLLKRADSDDSRPKSETETETPSGDDDDDEAGDSGRYER